MNAGCGASGVRKVHAAGRQQRGFQRIRISHVRHRLALLDRDAGIDPAQACLRAGQQMALLDERVHHALGDQEHIHRRALPCRGKQRLLHRANGPVATFNDSAGLRGKALLQRQGEAFGGTGTQQVQGAHVGVTFRKRVAAFQALKGSDFKPQKP